LVILLLLSVVLVGVGCKKMTGGGWFYQTEIVYNPDTHEMEFIVTDNKITFSFTAQPLDETHPDDDRALLAKGQFQLIDHSTKDRIHCAFALTGDGDMPDKPWVSFFAGPATLNGEGGYVAAVEFHNNTTEFGDIAVDFVSVSLIDVDDLDPNGGQPPSVLSYAGVLEGGNARLHEPK